MKESRYENRFKRALYYISFLSSLIYIMYRIFYTIPNSNITNIIIAIIVLIIETLEVFFYSIYCFNVLIYKKSSPETPKVKNKNLSPDSLKESGVFIIRR